MRIWDVDGTGLACPGAGFGRGCGAFSVSATIVHSTSIFTAVVLTVCRALKNVFAYTYITQSLRVHKFRNSLLRFRNISKRSIPLIPYKRR